MTSNNSNLPPISRRSLLKAISVSLAGVSGQVLADYSIAFSRINPSVTDWTEETKTMVASLCECIIPKTDTPGAIESGVPQFVESVYADLLSTEAQSEFFAALAELNKAAQEEFGFTFSECPVSEQNKIVSTFSCHSYELYKSLQRIITVGYFTSMNGVTKALSYNPMPLKYDGSVEVSGFPKQWAY
ncbi:gluconate 2-dehydrogenase subunit 3 family protein [Alteromonas sp. RKMC-009]|uniref:gluconate 2-dehydrogenase subunit 3 family protein n=1 Tax=Alteromonas sp. RKMC-009 TaxID=2267264 RepID=UPI000E6A467C|nr:gluconate 2-dehydrogenase subunit 3 family protein [Alteromonas sp. RKMC-009]AYA63400.1 gluconate 2-dehydrogenase subunit 3 family protein [Alteromonas sp. RKMC-009]